MKKRTKIFLICCVILAIVLLIKAIYFQEVVLAAIAGGIIGSCVCYLEL